MKHGRWAMISKVHHCMVDGVSATDLLSVLIDVSPDVEPTAEAPWLADTEPTGVRLVADSLSKAVVDPVTRLPGLPVGLADPIAPLADRRTQLEGLKSSGRAVAGDALTRMSGFAPPMLLAAGARLATRFQQRLVQTCATNVPGPRVPLYVLGRPLRYSYPYVPVVGTVRITIAIFSYEGRLFYGITADYD